MKTRIISAIIGIPLVIGIILTGGMVLTVFIALLAAVGSYEYYRAFENKGFKPIKKIGSILAAVYVLLSLTEFKVYSNVAIFLIILVIFTYEIIFRKHDIIDISITLFPFVYIAVFFTALGEIYFLKGGAFLIWLPILAAWYTDTMAYAVGLTFGKHKLAPEVSPKKSIEGAIGGFLGCSLLMLLTGFIARKYGVELSLINFVLIGLCTGVTAQIGDLATSYIKRYCGIKDFGNLIPGHGGVMDRFDSILFTAPTVLYYLMFVVGIK